MCTTRTDVRKRRIVGRREADGHSSGVQWDAFVQSQDALEVQNSSGGVGMSIVGILEVIESDSSEILVDLSIEGQEADSSYQEMIQTIEFMRVSE